MISDKLVGGFPVPLPPKLETLIANRINLPYAIPKIHLISHNSLKHLEVSMNHLFCWGGPLIGFDHLEYLDLSDNLCTLINLDFFSNTTNIKTMLLNGNSFGYQLKQDTGGRFFSYLVKLQHLEMRKSLITKLSGPVFLENTQLQHLDLSRNFLRTFDADISASSNLLILNVSYNQLSGLTAFTVNQIRDTIRQQKIIRRQPNNSVHLQVDIRGQVLECSYEFHEFLHFLCTEPSAFVHPLELTCSMPNEWTGVKFKQFPRFCPDLRLLQQIYYAEDRVYIFQLIKSRKKYNTIV